MFDKEKIKELFPQAEDLMFEPMLMWSTHDKSILTAAADSGEYFGSIKKDGAFYQIVKTQDYIYLFGRTVSRVTGLLTEKHENVPHICEALRDLPPRTILIAEIYYPGKTSRDTTSIMGCLPAEAIKRQKDNPIHAYVHDIIYYDDVDLRQCRAMDRQKILKAVWKTHNLNNYNFLELAVPVYENVLEEANLALARGEEGMVLRRKDGTWQCGKRPARITIKVKQSDAIDLVCTGTVPPTKEYTGKELDTWQYFIIYKYDNNLKVWYEIERTNIDKRIRSIDYKTVPVTKPYYYGWPGAIKIGAYDDNGELIDLGTVSSGLTDEDKDNISKNPNHYIGCVVSLGCMQVDKTAKTLRHPIFKSWREDKNPKECKISEIFC